VVVANGAAGCQAEKDLTKGLRSIAASAGRSASSGALMAGGCEALLPSSAFIVVFRKKAVN